MTDQPQAADPGTTGSAPGGSAPAGTTDERIVIRDKRKIKLTGNPAGEAGAGDATGATGAGTDAASGGKPVVKDPNPDPEPSAVDAEPVIAAGEVDDTESTAAAATVDDVKSSDSGPEVVDSVTTDGGAEATTDPAATTEPPAGATGEPATSAIDDAEVAEALASAGPEGPVVDAPAEPVSGGAAPAEEQQQQEVAALNAELEALRAELEERTQDLQRVTAEYANYRKRVERDRGLVAKETTGAVLTALLPVLDDLDRAREHGDLVGPFGAVAEHLINTLTKFGLTPFGEKGDPFDPNRHEAVAHQTSTEVTEPTCVDVMRRGYQLGDRVLRAALVAVADPE